MLPVPIFNISPCPNSTPAPPTTSPAAKPAERPSAMSDLLSLDLGGAAAAPAPAAAAPAGVVADPWGLPAPAPAKPQVGWWCRFGAVGVCWCRIG